MRKRRILLPFFAMALIAALSLSPLLVGCDGATPDISDMESNVPIVFDTKAMTVQTRAGETTTANITSMGVFASYTGQGNFSNSNSYLNYMCLQKITRTNSASPWTYTPIKYWPNNSGDKISFFAYAPHVDNMTFINFLLPTIGNRGELHFLYTPPITASDQTDVLVAASLNLTRTGTVGLTFQHITAKVTFQILSEDDITVKNVIIGDAITRKNFYLGETGLRWGASEMDAGREFTATVNKSITANVKTDVATFFMVPNLIKSENATTGRDTKVTLVYIPKSGISQSKNVLLPRGWDPGEAVNYILKVEKEKLIISASGGMTWTSGTEQIITDSSAF